MIGRSGWLMLAGAALIAAGAPVRGGPPAGMEAPARPPVDGPELARLGPFPVGVAATEFVQPAQLDPTQGTERPVLADRHLALTIWYPAAAAGAGTTYHTALAGEDNRDVAFDVPGIATPDSAGAAGRFPLVILAHGYGNTPAVLAWLGENLASKGYVVVAPAFGDPPINIRTALARSGPIARRPLDIAFIAAEAARRSRAGDPAFAHADGTLCQANFASDM